MIEEYGTIVELKGHQIALVLCQRNSACEHCATSGACQITADSQSMLVEAFNGIGAEISDRVKIATSSKNFLRSSFMLYIMPMIGLLLGAVAGQTVGENYPLGIDPSLLSAILGVAFMFATFLCIRVCTRALNKELFMPQIIEIQPQPAAPEEELLHGH